MGLFEDVKGFPEAVRRLFDSLLAAPLWLEYVFAGQLALSGREPDSSSEAKKKAKKKVK